MNLVIGLGNPGQAYQRTRHNVGYRTVEFIAEGVRFSKKWKFSCTVKKDSLLLVKPLTFMNRSGSALHELLAFYKCDPSQVIVLCDDFALPVDVIRLRRKGSSGGHKGLQSVIDHIHTDNFPRLRIGVGPVPQGLDPAQFVLEKLNDAQMKQLDTMVVKAAECIRFALEHGIEKAMNEYNK